MKSFLFTAALASSAVTCLARPGLSVPDLISLTRFGSTMAGGFGGDDLVVSPDGTRVVTIVQRGILRDNSREFLLLMVSATRPASPTVLARFVTGANEPGISQTTWLTDDTVAFLGESGKAPRQVYSLNVDKPQLVQLTHSALPITLFGGARAGAAIAFVTEEPPAKKVGYLALRQHGFVVPPSVHVSDVIAGNWERIVTGKDGPKIVHWVREGKEFLVELPDPTVIGDCLEDHDGFSLSPAGDSLLLRCHPQKMPAHWIEYQEEEFKRGLQMGGQYPWWVVLDLRTGEARPLTGAPIVNFASVPQWQGDRLIVIDDLLPLEGMQGSEREARACHRMTAEIDARSGTVKIIEARGRESRKAAVFAIEEGMNVPWKLIGRHTTFEPNVALLKARQLARATTIQWDSPSGAQLRAGIYWPLGYRKGKRYPAVIQTHGFEESKFAPDGYSTTGYAAQPLANAGILVVQAHRCVENCATPERVRLGEGGRIVEDWQSLIDELDRRGLIDVRRIGLQGFSRSCFHVLYFLTHSRYPVTAMTCTDGVDFGYLQYLIFAPLSEALVGEYAVQNGGVPYGDNFKTWKERAAGFNLDRIQTPARFMALGDPSSLLEEWEPFAGLILQGKPVELFYLPDAEHNIVRPWERFASQQGAVDWFRFWLQGHERTEAVVEAEETAQILAAQYAHWRELMSQTVSLKKN